MHLTCGWASLAEQDFFHGFSHLLLNPGVTTPLFHSHHFLFSLNLRIRDEDSKVLLLTTGKHMLKEELKSINLVLHITACLFYLKTACMCQCAGGIVLETLAEGNYICWNKHTTSPLLTIHRIDPDNCSNWWDPLHRDFTVARPKSPIFTVRSSWRKISKGEMLRANKQAVLVLSYKNNKQLQICNIRHNSFNHPPSMKKFFI